ncbi:hypothetical protein N7532_003305 [Penicillium argentinense]|uniref:Uncharacterized protein n=1 Tax=Penicillium argentinense TaxID=1131581 RepID=A0A9W9FM65_9EURO|nr:uncharacterized protein N7532_003305 [Penicillium argentinense]KAJ5102776.1 hypothetical protein N7532_003305 [Penicillium argentinense]
MFLIWCSMSHLRADIQEQAITDPNKILAKAYTIEQDLNTWFANLPPSFSYTTHIVPPNSYTIKQKCRGITPYNNKYHIYNAFWISELYNQYRCMRILVSEIIFSHLQKLPSPTASCREHEHRALISHFSDEICHSIPFSLGACNSETPPEVRAVPPENYIAGLLLIWPLYLAGAAEQLSHPRRRWVLHAARVIGHSMGVELGLRIMDILNVAPCILDEEEIWSDEISVKYVKEGDGVDCAG